MAGAETNPEAGRSWHAGATVGVAVPRRDLDPGIFVGARGTLALDEMNRVRARVDLDWVRMSSGESTVLAPPVFPRSANNLDRSLNAVTVAAGADIVAARIGDIVVRAGLSLGAQVGRERFEAYGMSRTFGGVGPAVTADVSVSGNAGTITWRALIGWRESRINLDMPGDLGGQVTSGGIVGAGADW